MMSIIERIIRNSCNKRSSLRTTTYKYSNHALSDEEIIFESVKDKGIITLNRPKVLNALSLSMVKKLYNKLKQWEKDKSFVILKGNGEFCVGGDVTTLIEASLRKETFPYNMFRNCYMLCDLIGSYKIPQIAFIDGIVMGGGVGISVHGQYRIATDRTVFAMPENGIGLFPDAGASYFFPRLTENLGYYLGLTGHRLKGIDVFKAGIATHYCESKKLPHLEKALLDISSEQEIKEVLKKFTSESTAKFSLEPFLQKINSYFSAETVEEILKELNKDGSEWARSNITVLEKKSPTSLKICLKALTDGSHLTLQECLKMDFRVAMACLANNDLYEGVRAQLIDKDYNPKWNPNSLSAVTDEFVNRYFNKLPDDQELHFGDQIRTK